MSIIDERLAIVDWRERVSALYREIQKRRSAHPERAFDLFRTKRDELFKHHPASPLDDAQRQRFEVLSYFEYRRDLNVEGELIGVDGGSHYNVELGDDGVLLLSHIVDARFSLGDVLHSLPVYWLDGYGGGIFIPFQDKTNGVSTYGGGRYLFDTRKGANLGIDGASIRLDFNFAYNPSCAYNERWVCPLPRRENRLRVAVPAGERYVDLEWTGTPSASPHERRGAN